jgi:L-lactate permease
MATALKIASIFDVFSQSMQFRTSRSNGKLPSVIGAIFSIAIFVLVLPYFLQKYSVLVNKEDQSIDVEITSQVYTDYEYLDMKIGRAIEPQGYEFRLAIVIYDY